VESLENQHFHALFSFLARKTTSQSRNINMNEFGGLNVVAGSTALNCPATTGVELNSTRVPTLAAIAAGQFGASGVSAAAATGRLSLSPGTYLVTASLTLEGEHTSATSGDAIGNISLQLAKGGTLQDGMKATANTVAEGQQRVLTVQNIVEVTQASQDADTATNYVSMYLIGGDSSGNDVIVREGQFTAVRLR
jgi:hypothetical protein